MSANDTHDEIHPLHRPECETCRERYDAREIGQIAHLAEAILVNCTPPNQVSRLTIDLIESAFDDVVAQTLRTYLERTGVRIV